MKLIEKFAAYAEKHKIPMGLNQQQTIVEANTLINKHIKPADIEAIYIALYGSYAAIFLCVKNAPKPKNDGRRITLRLFGTVIDYQKYTSLWLDAARKSPSKTWYYIPKVGTVRKMHDAASAEWAMHNINSQGKMIYLEL